MPHFDHRSTLTVAVCHIGRRAVLKPEGDIDAASSAALRAAIEEAVRAGAFEVWLDLTETGFMDSTGLRIVFALRSRLEELRRHFAVICPAGRVRRVFELAGVAHALPLYPTLSAAQRET